MTLYIDVLGGFRYVQWHAGMAELADALDLGSSIERCVGSTPSTRTSLRSFGAAARHQAGHTKFYFQI